MVKSENASLFDWQLNEKLRQDFIEPIKPEPIRRENWPPDYRSVYAWRIRQVQILKNDPGLLASAKEYYKHNTVEFINHWVDTYDPRRPSVKWVPFVFFWRQYELINFFEDCANNGENGLVEKCRDAGVTWGGCAFSVKSWLFNNDDAIGWGSRKEDLVDKLGEPDSIFEKMRLILRRLPSIFLPAGFEWSKHATFMKLINPENGSVVSGEAGDNIGRGGRKRVYFKDEAQPLNANILTPFGWSTMGEMCIGSKVIGSNGKSTNVIAVNDCDEARVYRVTFSDGTSVECSENHLWTVERKIGKKITETLRTVQLIDNIKYQSPGGQKQFRYRIPTVKPIEFSNQRILPLDPWIVGALIGDGSVRSGCIKFTSSDPENIVRFLERCPEGTSLSFDKDYNWRFIDSGNRYNKSSNAKNSVINAGIYGCRSYEKYIPDDYKFSSVENRIELLRGLMDTDGSASGGVASFHSCSEQLANDVRFIVQSLGGTATINVKKDHRGYRDMFVIHMTIPNIIPFYLSRKKDKLRNRIHPVDKTIVNIEYIRNDAVRCITVDNEDGLYVTDNCILTHNSAHYERPEKIEAALGDNTNCQIDISSVNGLGNVFHRRREAGVEWSPGAKIDPGYTRVFIIDWRDHPEKTQEWYDLRKAKFEREGMAHIFAQEVDRNYSASIQNTIIPYEWIVAAVDAHLKFARADGSKGIKESELPDVWDAGLDVADGGTDRNAMTKKQWIIWRDVEEWGERDIGVTTRRCVASIRGLKRVRVFYDIIGMGSTVKAEANRLYDEKIISRDNVQFIPWNAGGAVLNPYDRIIPKDQESAFNRDFYKNLKAQAWGSTRTRFYKTWKNITEGVIYPVDEMISLDSRMKLLQSLMKELAQATLKEATSDLRMVVDKTPSGTKSPNLADSGIMAFFPVPLDSSMAIVGNYGA